MAGDQCRAVNADDRYLAGDWTEGERGTACRTCDHHIEPTAVDRNRAAAARPRDVQLDVGAIGIEGHGAGRVGAGVDVQRAGHDRNRVERKIAGEGQRAGAHLDQPARIRARTLYNEVTVEVRGEIVATDLQEVTAAETDGPATLDRPHIYGNVLSVELHSRAGVDDIARGSAVAIVMEGYRRGVEGSDCRATGGDIDPGSFERE